MAAAPAGAPGCVGDGAVTTVSTGAVHQPCCDTAEGHPSCCPGSGSLLPSRAGMGWARRDGPWRFCLPRAASWAVGLDGVS